MTYLGCAQRCVDGTGNHDVEPAGHDDMLFADVVVCVRGCGLRRPALTDEKRFRLGLESSAS
jgi:hypothetical protein